MVEAAGGLTEASLKEDRACRDRLPCHPVRITEIFKNHRVVHTRTRQAILFDFQPECKSVSEGEVRSRRSISHAFGVGFDVACGRPLLAVCTFNQVADRCSKNADGRPILGRLLPPYALKEGLAPSWVNPGLIPTTSTACRSALRDHNAISSTTQWNLLPPL